MGIGLFARIASLITHQRISDPTSGFQLMRIDVARFFCSEVYPTDYPDADILILLHRTGYRVCEVPVQMRPSPGQSMHTGHSSPLLRVQDDALDPRDPAAAALEERSMITTNLRIIAIVGSVALLVFVIELVRRRRLKEEYSVLWVTTAVVLLLLAAWGGLLRSLTHAIGAISQASTLYFFGLDLRDFPALALLDTREQTGASGASRRSRRSPSRASATGHRRPKSMIPAPERRRRAASPPEDAHRLPPAPTLRRP